jgi:hypothetical protein
MKKYFTRSQKMTIVQGIQSIVLMIDILQLWLLTATMNSYLGGDTGVPVPAAIFSLICFALNIGLLKFLYGLDRVPSGANQEAVSRSNRSQQH